MLNLNDIPDRHYNDLLAAALRGSALDEQERAWLQASRNAARTARWRYRSLLCLGHWPDGNVADWRDACVESERDDLGFFKGLVACIGLTAALLAGFVLLFHLLGALAALRG